MNQKSPLLDFNQQANTIHWPPLLYGAAFVLPWVLSWLLPLPLLVFSRPLEDILVSLGWALMATGGVVGYLALRSFAGAETPFSPTARAEKLVTFGLYNNTRNPMYLGAMIAFFGLALSTGNIWRFTMLPPLFVGLQQLAIIREEAHLQARFGPAWTEYAGKVRRWW
jgi:protein-S-isoprenylcysteine O-methyltransferase Ste14